jgi:hypothetical protein
MLTPSLGIPLNRTRSQQLLFHTTLAFVGPSFPVAEGLALLRDSIPSFSPEPILVDEFFSVLLWLAWAICLTVFSRCFHLFIATKPRHRLELERFLSVHCWAAIYFRTESTLVLLYYAHSRTQCRIGNDAPQLVEKSMQRAGSSWHHRSMQQTTMAEDVCTAKQRVATPIQSVQDGNLSHWPERIDVHVHRIRRMVARC